MNSITTLLANIHNVSRTAAELTIDNLPFSHMNGVRALNEMQKLEFNQLVKKEEKRQYENACLPKRILISIGSMTPSKNEEPNDNCMLFFVDELESSTERYKMDNQDENGIKILETERRRATKNYLGDAGVEDQSIDNYNTNNVNFYLNMHSKSIAEKNLNTQLNFGIVKTAIGVSALALGGAFIYSRKQ